MRSVAIVLFVLLSTLAHADVPLELSYQGLLLDESGVPMNGNVQVMARLWNDEISGDVRWAQSYPSVPVINGVLTLTLSNVTPTNLDYDRFWLELEVNGETLAPRQPLQSVPFAVRAYDAETLRGNTYLDLLDLADARTAYAIANHAVQWNVHHQQMNDFGLIDGEVAERQIVDSITRDTELAASLATRADANHLHDEHYYSQTEVDALLAPLLERLDTLETQVANLEAGVDDPELVKLAAFLTVQGNDVYLDGANLHLRNGQGWTDTANGLGNLIVGYNKNPGAANPGFGTGDPRTGSHNVVIGDEQDWRSWGGLLAGRSNLVTGPWSTVVGGWGNSAGSAHTAILGGQENQASGAMSTISGGAGNSAGAKLTSILGGEGNQLTGERSTISGGIGNSSGATHTSILGGEGNQLTGAMSTISGGLQNSSGATHTSILGGRLNVVSANGSTLVGGDAQTITAPYAVGGMNNVFDGIVSIEGGDTVVFDGVNVQIRNGSGNTSFTENGLGNLIIGYNELRTAGNDRSGSHNLLIGKRHNFSSTSGLLVGDNNEITHRGAVALGTNNLAAGTGAMVLGGQNNQATAGRAAVLGGEDNSAGGVSGVVTGGRYNRADGTFSSVGGGLSNHAAQSLSTIPAGRHQRSPQ